MSNFTKKQADNCITPRDSKNALDSDCMLAVSGRESPILSDQRKNTKVGAEAELRESYWL
jgi:hypothetical protein